MPNEDRLVPAAPQADEASSALEQNRSLLGVTDNDAEAQRRRAIRNAQETGLSCAECARTLGPAEPVWRENFSLGRGFFGGNRRTVAPHCEACKSKLRHFCAAKPCKSCGRPVRDENYKQQSFCSERCRRAGRLATARDQRRHVRGTTRACERCDEQFEPTRTDSRFCSNSCRQAAYRARSAVTASTPLPREHRNSRNAGK
jgi:hypothetical protein